MATPAKTAPNPDKPAAAAAPPAPPKKVAPAILHVLDLTAVRTNENPTGTRTHDMIVDGVKKPFTFEPGKPLALPTAVAIKFLQHTDGFKFTDAEGNLQEYRRRPKQPDELQAGEQLVLEDDQTVARLEELSTPSLQKRALELPGSDHFAENPSRQALIKFLQDITVARRAANKSKQPDIAKDEYDPLGPMDGFDLDDAEAA